MAATENSESSAPATAPETVKKTAKKSTKKTTRKATPRVAGKTTSAKTEAASATESDSAAPKTTAKKTAKKTTAKKTAAKKATPRKATKPAVNTEASAQSATEDSQKSPAKKTTPRKATQAAVKAPEQEESTAAPAKKTAKKSAAKKTAKKTAAKKTAKKTAAKKTAAKKTTAKVTEPVITPSKKVTSAAIQAQPAGAEDFDDELNEFDGMDNDELDTDLSPGMDEDLDGLDGDDLDEDMDSDDLDEDLESDESSDDEEDEDGSSVWDEDESAALRQARKDAELTASADSVRAYLKQIGKVALLNAEQEVSLAKRIEAGLYATFRMEQMEEAFHNGDREAKLTPAVKRDLRAIARDGRKAKNHLLEANLRLVVSLAKRYTGRGMAFLDLIQEGNLGLIRAVEKFDYTKGYKFSTYATWWIRQAITRAMADQARTIRIPVHMVEVINKLGRIQRELLQDLGREPTPQELAKEMDITEEKVLEIQQYAREPISLDQTIGDEGDSQLGDFIEDSEAVIAVDAVSFTLLQDQLQDVLHTLSEREAGVVKLRFGLTDGMPRTLDEIGQVYGVTRERIRQIESKTMSKLRHPSRSQVLRDYLD